MTTQDNTTQYICARCRVSFGRTIAHFPRHGVRNGVQLLSPYCKKCTSLKNKEAREKKKKDKACVDDIALPFKKCKDCLLFFPHTEHFFKFVKDLKRGQNYFVKRCNKCRKTLRRVENLSIEEQEKKNKQSKRWRDKNPEKTKIYQRTNFEKQPEAIREKRRVSAQRFRKMFPEKARASVKRSLDNHPETKKRGHQKRKALVKGLPFFWEKYHEKFAITYWHACCAYCGQQPGLWHWIVFDHFIALSNPLSPGTVAMNMIPACHAKPNAPYGSACCNTSKRAKDPIAWLTAKLGPRKAKAKLKEIALFFEAACAYAVSEQQAS